MICMSNRAADINFNCAHCTQQTFKSNGVQYSDCVNDNLVGNEKRKTRVIVSLF